MKKMIPLLITGFILASSVWAEVNNNVNPGPADISITPATTTSANHMAVDDKGNMSLTSSDDEAVAISKNMKIISTSKHEADQKLNYSVDISYPQIQGKNISTGAKQFNQMIENIVMDEVKQFKKLMAIDSVHMNTLPEEARKNSLSIDYDIDIIRPKNQTLISVRISIEGLQAGRAHPYHNNRVVNFDLTNGKVLTLNDLFKKNSKFLQLIASYSSKSLNEKLKKDNWMISQGTKPDVHNFKNWNLQADSILITFDEYQVAPYVYGAQEVEVPYSQLKKVLSARAPIAECAKDASNCQVG